MRDKVIMPLAPMTIEKHALIEMACKEWNWFLFRGKHMQDQYWKSSSLVKNQTAWKNRALFQRRYAMKQMRARRTIHHKLALHGLWQGLFSQTIYTPDSGFFIPGYMMKSDGDHIWFRLYPRLDLGFKFWGPVPYQVRVTRKGAMQWELDYLIDP